MRDEDIRVEAGLTPAETAVASVLKRVRVDVDLRWLMVDTEVFHRLCEAEAFRIGKPAEEVEEMYATLVPRCQSDRPRIKTYREALDRIAELCDGSVRMLAADEAILAIRAEVRKAGR